MSTRPKKYLAFLLRLWQTKHDGNDTWYASLEDSHTGEKRGFASLDALMEYLRRLVRKRRWRNK